MKINKEIRRLSREMLRASFTDGQLDPGRITKIRSKLVDSLKEKYGGDLTAEFVVSPELLGGMRVRVGSDVWDGTVRNRLEQLQQQL